MIRLNLGCGEARINDFINIDLNEDFKPDLVLNFITNRLPYEDESVNEIVMFHTIEHIEKRFHASILREIHRVLKKDGVFFISFPEFSKILQNWLENKLGDRVFWEATIYGRQTSKGDYHVSAIDTDDFTFVLRQNGLSPVNAVPEPLDDYNTIMRCVKSTPATLYERVIYDDMTSILK